MRLIFLGWVLTVFTFPNVSWGLCVTANKANLRGSPSSKGKPIWTVGKYMPLIQVKRKGGWYQVKDLDGKKMWISSGLVSSRIDCAVIRIPSSTLRKGPGKRFPTTLSRLAYKYTPFRKIDRDGAWLKLKDDFGYDHWVHESNIWEPLEYTRLSY